VAGSEITNAVLEDYTTAPIDERLRAMLSFLKKLTLTPQAVTADDARPVLAAGVSREAFTQALYVQAMFAFITRCADAFDFEIPPESSFVASAGALIKMGYRL
jgi:alkylhydroperoxidase family enzyme